MQLVAYGAQDAAITGTPDVTFWKASYRKYTNFAMESIEQVFNGQADFGRRITAIISRSGDLIYRTYLQVTLPEINCSMNTTTGQVGQVYARWLDYIGEQMIAQVQIDIGGQTIDKQYGDYMHIWNQLTMNAEQERGYRKMIGFTTQLSYLTDPTFANISSPCTANGAPSQVCAPRNALPETTLYIPMQFWFCNNPGLALPLIALQFHEVKFTIDIRPIGECLWAVGSLTNTAGNQTVSTCYSQSLVAASLYVDYIFLDTDERRNMAAKPHEYLIEQLQYTGDESVGSSSNKIKLNFNHPTKEIIWVVQPDVNVDYCGSYAPDSGSVLFKTLGAQPFNYTDAIDALPKAIHAFGGEKEVAGPYGFIASNGIFEMPGALDAAMTSSANTGVTGSFATNTYGQWFSSSGTNGYSAPFTEQNGTTNPTGSTVSDAGTFVLAETALDMHCWGENPVVTAKLQINGQDRFSEREGSYFDVVQPWQHHTRNPDTGINIYSFALRPEEYQPSGTINFSRIDNATLMLVLSAATVTGYNTAKVRVYAKNYNFLRITSGMAGIAYAN